MYIVYEHGLKIVAAMDHLARSDCGDNLDIVLLVARSSRAIEPVREILKDYEAARRSIVRANARYVKNVMTTDANGNAEILPSKQDAFDKAIRDLQAKGADVDVQPFKVSEFSKIPALRPWHIAALGDLIDLAA